MFFAVLLIPLALVVAFFFAEPANTTEQLKPRENYTEQYSGLHFAHMKDDCFLMGDLYNKGEVDEQPVRRVCIGAYGLSFTEVTVKQFRDFVEDTGYRTSAETLGYCYDRSRDGIMVRTPGLTWRNPGFPQEDNHPVVCISAEDAQAYAVWLSAKSERTFRLPTEAEWEYAAHGGQKLTEYGTADGNMSREQANFKGEGNKDQFSHTAPVGSFAPNSLGLYDMSGNVYEWVQDTMASYDATCLNNPVACGDAERVKRGGSYAVDADYLRASNRGSQPMASTDLGFRLALDKSKLK